MRIDHVGIEVRDLYAVELFYRKALGFAPRYRHVSRNTPGLRTVFLERDGVALELLERPRGDAFPGDRAGAPNHVSLAVDDVDAAHARLAAMGLPAGALTPPRDTGDGYREMSVRDPEGNVVELSARVRPEPRHPVQAVVFDVDGTLLDTEEPYLRADQELLARRGIPFTREDKRRYVGGGNLDMMADLKARFGLPESPEALAAEKNAIYLELARDARAFPEMERFLRRVRARGIPVAAASGSSPAVLHVLLEATGLAALLDAIVSAEEVPRGKPAPDVFLEAARRLGAPAQACVAVEDSRPGVEAACRAFMRCIAVPYLLEDPLPDGFLMADLLFERGMSTFDADRAWAWLEPLLAGRGGPGAAAARGGAR
ncbi:MAG TPA: HAD-IA family hydrolase [Anaeromyxobacteraceae bacterium]|nr:HAD-IA family hydrolase [Anaeromyxobacteraceae bacterium]